MPIKIMSRRSTTFVIPLAIFLIGTVVSAYAGGAYYFRELTTSDLGSCPSGKLVERLYNGGDIHGFDSSLFVACQTTSDTAVWIVASGQGCHGSRICRLKRGVISPESFFTKYAFSTQRTVTFNLLKTVRGGDCHLQTYTETDKLPEADAIESKGGIWTCSHYETYSGIGITDQGGFSQARSKPVRVVDVGQEPPQPDPDYQDHPTDLGIPSQAYTVDYVSEIVDP